MAPRKSSVATIAKRKASSIKEQDTSSKKRKRSSTTNITSPCRSNAKRVRSVNNDDVEGGSGGGEVNEQLQIDSDDLDEIESDHIDDRWKGKKKETITSKKTATPTTTPKRSKRKTITKSELEDDEEEEQFLLDQGQEIVGRVVKAPTTGLVPPGQISQNTLKFLNKLKDPKCNDRQWFKLHEPVYRQAEKEWKLFIESFTDVLISVDPEIPPLPPKDVVHRIYRDVRFSNDKTPYKRGFSASFSRSGRKGIFAGYHVVVKPGHESMIAAGSWCPGRNELATIRANIQRNPRRLRQIISSPEFENYFGKAKPQSNGERSNIFGMEDELKTAPKGVPKDHKDIDLLKCRSFAVVHRFTDDEVLDPEFKHAIGQVAHIMQPFVHCILTRLLPNGVTFHSLNDMMTVTPDSDGSGDSEDDDDADEGGDGVDYGGLYDHQLD